MVAAARGAPALETVESAACSTALRSMPGWSARQRMRSTPRRAARWKGVLGADWPCRWARSGTLTFPVATAGPAEPAATGARHLTLGPEGGKAWATLFSRQTPSRLGPIHWG